MLGYQDLKPGFNTSVCLQRKTCHKRFNTKSEKHVSKSLTIVKLAKKL